MKRFWFGCLLIFLVPGFVAPAGARPKAPKNIILIGWDGAQREHVRECLDRGELPNLKRLASRGILVAIDILRTTDTKSGWTQILTGYEPEITGVFSNSRYGPIPKGYTVFERLESHFGKDQITTVAIIGKKGHVDADGPQRIEIKKNMKLENLLRRHSGGRVIEENGTRYLEVPAKPYFFTKDGMDLFQNGLGENDIVGRVAMEMLQKFGADRFFFFVHFADVDHLGHRFGENSKEYNDALISCDLWTGRLMEKLKELKIDDDTMVYVTADHGFDENMKTHNDAPYVFLATNDRAVVRRGNRADITPTILARFGLNLKEIQPALSGHPLTEPLKTVSW